MTYAQGLLRLLWVGPEVGVLRDWLHSYFCIRSEKAQRLLQPISRSYLIILKLATFLQPLIKVLHRHNVYYLKLLLNILIYCITFRDLLFEKSIMKVENVRNLRCFTNRKDF